MKTLIKIVAFTLVVLTLSFQTKAADIYWVGNGGNWSDVSHWSLSSGGSSCGCLPTVADDVYFNAASFSSSGQTVTLNTIANTLSLNWSGLDEAVTWTGSFSANVYGDYILSPLLTNSMGGTIFFKAPTGLVQIDLAGIPIIHAIDFQGANAQWMLQDSISSTRDIFMRSGALVTNGHKISIRSFFGNYSSPYLLVLGNSEIVISSTWTISTIDSYTLPSTSTIRMQGTNATFQGGGLAYNTIIAEGAGANVRGDNAINTLTILNGGTIWDSQTFGTLNLEGGKIYRFGQGETTTVTGAFNVLSDCSKLTTLRSSTISPTSFSTISKTSGSVNLDYVYIDGLNATGGASFNAANGTVYNSTGWNISAPVTQNLYWIGGDGSWDDGANWSFTSGGAVANCVPNRNTNVFFNVNSFSGSGERVLIVQGAFCKSMQWSGVTGTPEFEMKLIDAELYIYGSLTLDANMTMDFTKKTYLRAPSGTSTIDLNGQALNSLYFQGEGRYRLTDDLTATFLYHEFGRFDTQGFDLFISGYNSNYTNPRILRLSNSTMHIAPGTSAEWTMNTENMVFDAGNSLIEFAGGSQFIYGDGLVLNDVTFLGNACTAGNLSYVRNLTFNSGGSVSSVAQVDNVSTTGGTLAISGTTSIGTASAGGAFTTSGSGNYQVDDLQVAGTSSFNGTGYYPVASIGGDATFNGVPTFGVLTLGGGQTCKIQSGTTLSIETNLVANGSCSGITVFEPNGVTNGFISKALGTLTLDYVSLTGITAIGGASFTANNATDGGGNIGWTLNQPVGQTLFWIGGSGNWSDPSNWSASSGGPAQSCLPSQRDNVVFDANSFSASGQEVVIDEPAFCNGMLCSSVTNTPTISITALGAELSIFGSMLLSPSMVINFTKPVYFKSPAGVKNLQFAGHEFWDIYFSGGMTEWRLLDELRSRTLFHESGSLNTNSHDLHILGYYSNTSLLRRLKLGSSTMNILTLSSSNEWVLNTTNYVLDAGTSRIILPGNNQSISGSGLNFYEIEFLGTSCSVININSIKRIYFQGTNGTMSSIGHVEYAIGTNLTLSVSTTVDTLIANGTYNSSSGTTTIGMMQVANTATFNGTHIIGSAMLSGDGNFNDFTSFDTLFLSAGKTYTLEQNQTQRVNDLLFGMGACDQQIIIQTSGVAQASLQIDSGIVDLHEVSITGIKAIGATDFVITNASDGSNNEGWVLLQPATTTYYWVGDGGNWSDPAHWATTSGGAAQVCLPTRADDVVFDINSFSLGGEIVLVDGDALCRSVFWSSLDNTPTWSLPSATDFQIYGALELSPDMNVNVVGNIIFEADAPDTFSIFLSGHSLDDVYFRGDSGIWVVEDTFRSQALFHERGTLKTNDETLFISRYAGNYTNPRSLQLGNSDVYISWTNSSAWTLNTANFSFDEGTSNIIFTGVSSSSPSLQGAGLNFYEATWTGFNATLTNLDTIQIVNFQNTGTATMSSFDYVGEATFAATGNISGSGKVEKLTTQGTMNFNGGLRFNDVVLLGNANFTNHPRFSNLTLTPGQEYKVTINDTLIVDNFLFADGTAGSLIFLHSSSGSGPGWIRKKSGQVCTDYINLQDIHTSGGASFNVGASSVDLGGNAGWNFSSCVYTCDEVSNHFITGLGTTVATLNFDLVEGAYNYLMRWREVGTSTWNFFLVDVNETPALPLSGLDFGVSYEWQVKVYCNESQTLESLWSTLQTFATTCVPPANLVVTNILTNAATFNWTPVPGAFKYTFQGRFAGTSAWFTLNIPNPAAHKLDVDVLSPNKTIEWRMRTTCSADGSVVSIYSPIQNFTTQDIPVPPACVVNLGPAMVDVCGIDTVLDAGPGFQYYLWNTGDTTQTITVTTPGTYSVTVQWEFCTTGDVITVDFPGCLARMSADGSISALETEAGLLAFPNPANTYTQLVYPEAPAEGWNLRLLDIAGREVRSAVGLTGTTYDLLLEEIPSGLYLIELQNQSRTIKHKLLIEE